MMNVFVGVNLSPPRQPKLTRIDTVVALFLSCFTEIFTLFTNRITDQSGSDFVHNAPPTIGTIEKSPVWRLFAIIGLCTHPQYIEL